MAIPKIKEQDIIDALKYIDENGVPSQNQSTKYELVTEEGKKYPPKYVIAVAAHLATGGDISTDGFNAVEAKSYLQGKGYNIEIKQEKFELVISSESVTSTDERFTMDNLSLGDNYKPLGAFFRKANGEEIKRAYISSYGRKIIQDALVNTRVLKNDGWKQIAGFSDEFDVDPKNPRIEVVITEM